MERNIIWKGQQHDSLEHCTLVKTDAGAEVNSIITGMYENKTFRIEYQIIINQNWETTFFEIKKPH